MRTQTRTVSAFLLIAATLSEGRTARAQETASPTLVFHKNQSQPTDLKKTLDEVDRALEKSKKDEAELLQQQERLASAIEVIECQTAALAARQVTFEVIKKYLIAKGKANRLAARLPGLQKEHDKWSDKWPQPESDEWNAEQTATIRLSEAEKELWKLSNTVAHLDQEVEKSRDTADAAFLRALREQDFFSAQSKRNTTATGQ